MIFIIKDSKAYADLKCNVSAKIGQKNSCSRLSAKASGPGQICNHYSDAGFIADFLNISRSNFIRA